MIQLANFAVTLDYSAPSVTFADPERFEPRAHAIPFEVAGALIQLKATVNDDQELLFLVDTGASYTILPRAIGEALPGRHLGGVQATGAAGASLPMTVCRLPRLQLGPHTLTDVVVAYLEEDALEAQGALAEFARQGIGVLGADVLSRFRVTINYSTRVLLLEPVEEAASDLTWVHPGLQVMAAAEGYIIRSVLRPSPAAEAGLQPGDQLIAIDGEPIAALSPHEVLARLQGPAGSEVALEIKRVGTRRIVRVRRIPLL